MQFIVLLVCASFFYKAAEFEDRSGILWAGASAGFFVLTWMVFHWGFVGDLAGQAALFVGIALARVIVDRRKTL